MVMNLVETNITFQSSEIIKKIDYELEFINSYKINNNNVLSFNWNTMNYVLFAIIIIQLIEESDLLHKHYNSIRKKLKLKQNSGFDCNRFQNIISNLEKQQSQSVNQHRKFQIKTQIPHSTTIRKQVDKNIFDKQNTLILYIIPFSLSYELYYIKILKISKKRFREQQFKIENNKLNDECFILFTIAKRYFRVSIYQRKLLFFFFVVVQQVPLATQQTSLKQEKDSDCIQFLLHNCTQYLIEENFKYYQQIQQLSSDDKKTYFMSLMNDICFLKNVLQKIQNLEFNKMNYSLENFQEVRKSLVSHISQDQKYVKFLKFLVLLTAIDKRFVQCGKQNQSESHQQIDQQKQKNEITTLNNIMDFKVYLENYVAAILAPIVLWAYFNFSYYQLLKVLIFNILYLTIMWIHCKTYNSIRRIFVLIYNMENAYLLLTSYFDSDILCPWWLIYELRRLNDKSNQRKTRLSFN